ncbi:MAG: hypothetical protein JWO31_1345 [Phycisphaerales bacterium]|nr:hypothetical protein [Phycisphaerales bacterium]
MARIPRESSDPPARRPRGGRRASLSPADVGRFLDDRGLVPVGITAAGSDYDGRRSPLARGAVARGILARPAWGRTNLEPERAGSRRPTRKPAAGGRFASVKAAVGLSVAAHLAILGAAAVAVRWMNDPARPGPAPVATLGRDLRPVPRSRPSPPPMAADETDGSASAAADVDLPPAPPPAAPDVGAPPGTTDERIVPETSSAIGTYPDFRRNAGSRQPAATQAVE